MNPTSPVSARVARARGRPATILQIIPRLDTGGAELSTVEITQAIVAAGGRALVATAGGRLSERVEAAGGRIVAMPAGSKNPLVMLANSRILAKLIRSEAIDIVHARSRAPAWSALVACRRANVPLVTTYHGAYSERGPLKRAYNSVMARGDRVIANSNFTAGLIRDRYATPVDRIRVIHRGVDPGQFDPAAIPAARIAGLRAAWGIAPGRRIVLQAARLTGWKGQRVLIEAFSRLGAITGHGGAPGASLVLAGDDQGRRGYRDELARLAETLGVADHVHLVGHVADVPAAFAAAHVAVVASIEPEAFGRAATEAQAMGCPVIATRLGAPPETVVEAPEHARTGWLVAPGDAGQLAVTLAAALALEGGERATMGQRARRHIEADFTLAAMKSATLAVYDELTGGQLAGRCRDQAPARPSTDR